MTEAGSTTLGCLAIRADLLLIHFCIHAMWTKATGVCKFDILPFMMPRKNNKTNITHAILL